MDVTSRFSPDDDGRRDAANVRYRIADAGAVTILVRSHVPDRTHKIVRIGHQGPGTYTWRWNGRGRNGRTVRDGRYQVAVVVVTEESLVRRNSDITVVDRTFGTSRASLLTSHGMPEGRVMAVYPRTRVVRDALTLTPTLTEPLRRATLLVKDRRGRTVLRHDVQDLKDLNPHIGEGEDDVVWTGRRRGKPLAPGRYRAILRGEDMAGNTGRGPALRLWVSRERLTWQERAYDVGPAASEQDWCDYYKVGNACGEPPYPCGEVAASALYAGGLSYRSRECSAGDGVASASALHHLPLPETAGVRGIASAKISYTGRPTAEGETDEGELVVPRSKDGEATVVVTGASDVETPWVDHPLGSQGRTGWDDEPLAPGVSWWFATTGSDSVDVAKFAVTVRYLGVGD